MANRCDSTTMEEQKAKLDRMDVRHVFKQVQENTASLQLEEQDLHDAESILSEDSSKNSAFDSVLLNHPIYRKVYPKVSTTRTLVHIRDHYLTLQLTALSRKSPPFPTTRRTRFGNLQQARKSKHAEKECR